MNGYSQVTIKEKKPEHLDMWAFKDVVVGEVNKNTAVLEVKENIFFQVKTMKLEELQEDVVPAEVEWRSAQN